MSVKYLTADRLAHDQQEQVVIGFATCCFAKVRANMAVSAVPPKKKRKWDRSYCVAGGKCDHRTILKNGSAAGRRISKEPAPGSSNAKAGSWRGGITCPYEGCGRRACDSPGCRQHLDHHIVEVHGVEALPAPPLQFGSGAQGVGVREPAESSQQLTAGIAVFSPEEAASLAQYLVLQLGHGDVDAARARLEQIRGLPDHVKFDADIMGRPCACCGVRFGAYAMKTALDSEWLCCTCGVNAGAAPAVRLYSDAALLRAEELLQLAVHQPPPNYTNKVGMVVLPCVLVLASSHAAVALDDDCVFAGALCDRLGGCCRMDRCNW